MVNKKMIILVALIAIMCVAIGAIFLFNTTSYEKVELTPNGTSLEIPMKNMEYLGEVSGIKFWKWNYGSLAAYNSQQANNSSGAFALHVMDELLKNANIEMVDGFKVYRIDASQIDDFVGMDLEGKVYCISLDNETTHDNILICSNDKQEVTHVAQSVEYRN